MNIRLTLGTLLLMTIFYLFNFHRAGGQSTGQLKNTIEKSTQVREYIYSRIPMYDAKTQVVGIDIPENIYVYDNSDKYHSHVGCAHLHKAVLKLMKNEGKKTEGVSKRVPCGICMGNYIDEKRRAENY